MVILVVDDSKAMRLLIKRMIRQLGIDADEIIEAEDGALGLAKAKEKKPDLIISDWNMPNMTGIEFLKALRAEKNATKFGFVTTETSQETRDIATNAGAHFLIGKPFTKEAFELTIIPVLKAK